MNKWMTGGMAAVVIWFGAAAAAEAQVGTEVSGPISIYHNTTTFNVTGTLSGQSSYDYKITIVVNGITRVDRKPFFTYGSTINKAFNAGTWALAAGQSFVTTVDVMPQGTASDSLAITVTQGMTYLLPSRVLPSTAPAALKEEELAWSGADDEEAAA